MADKNSRLNLVKPQQAQKEVVINSLINALSPGAFGGKNEQASNGLVWGIYGGSTGSVLIANTTINLTDNATQYLSFNTKTSAFEISTTKFGDMPLYKITTSNGVATDWLDYRAGGGGGSGGGSDPNFVSNGAPATAPTATGNGSIAIGNGSVSSGENSLAMAQGEATKQASISMGQNVKTFTRFSATIAGVNNRIENGERSSIIGGSNNTIQGGDYSSIYGSESCTIGSASFSQAMILNSNQSWIGSNMATVITGYQSYIQNDAQFSTAIGNSANITSPYSVQMSFSVYNRQQFNGLTVESYDANDISMIMGANTSNVKRFRIQDNQVVNMKFTLIGVDSSFNVVKFTGEILAKRYGGATTFVGETSTTSKSLTQVVADTALAGTLARVVVEGQDLNIIVNGISGSVRWSCVMDNQLVQR